MKSYMVIWEINVDARNPRDAAKEAMRIQRDPKSWATIFKVQNSDGVITSIDLWAYRRKKEGKSE